MSSVVDKKYECGTWLDW